MCVVCYGTNQSSSCVCLCMCYVCVMYVLCMCYVCVMYVLCMCLCVSDMSPDIQQCLTETEACFNLLLPRMDTWNNDYFNVDSTLNSTHSDGNRDDNSTDSDSDEEDWVEVEQPSSSEGPSSSAGPSSISAGLEGHGISGREFSLTITLPQGKNTLLLEETEDNQSIFESLKGCHVLCENTYLPTVNKWLRVIIDCGIE